MYPDWKSRSVALLERAKGPLPGGNSRLAVWYSPYPLYFAKGRGCRVTDVDGVERLDCVNNMTALLHGHGHPDVVRAVQEQATRIMGCSGPTENEIRLAELVCDRVPGVEQIRFANSGTEAIMFAVRAARAYTGRQKVARVEGAYHGSADIMETSQVAKPSEWGSDDEPRTLIDSVGIEQSVADNVITIPYNNPAAARTLLERHAATLAAVIIDPFTPRLGFRRASPEFLALIREFCTRNRTALLFDEVMSFRSAYGGAQSLVGVLPDLTALGKIIGGGLPCGAIGGRREFMSVFDQSKGDPLVPHSGTNNANAVVMAAGAATLAAAPKTVYEHLDRLGQRLRAGMRDALKIAGVRGTIQGVGSLSFLFLGVDNPPETFREMKRATIDAEAYGLVHHYLINHGALSIDGQVFILSTPMQDADIDFLLEQLLGAFREVAQRPVRAAAGAN